MSSNNSLPVRATFLLLFLITSLVAPVHAGVPTGETTLLNVDFDDRNRGDMIGAGGAQAGEPSDLSGLQGFIDSDGSPDNYLRVENNSGATSSRSLRWDFLNNIEVTEGYVVIKFLMTLGDPDDYVFGVRESGGSSRSFLTVKFTSEGDITASDAEGVIPVTNDTWAKGQELAVVIELDMDAGTTDMNINGLPVVTNRSHKIEDRGVGRLYTGWAPGNAASPFLLDNLLVEMDGALPLVLDADFEDQALEQPIGTGGAELGQPDQVTLGMLTNILGDISGNRVLSLEYSSPGSASSVRWSFLDNLEVDSGILSIEMDLWFETLDDFAISIREGSSSTLDFANVRFVSSGNIYVTDDNATPVPTVRTYFAKQVYRLRIIYDLDAKTYSVLLDDLALVAGREYGVIEDRGVGNIRLGFSNTASDGARFTVDNLQVGASDALVLPSQLQFLVMPDYGLTNQSITPAMEVKATTVFDEIVPNGTNIEINSAIAPQDGILTGNVEATVAGVATFDQLKADMPGSYFVEARSVQAIQSGPAYIIIEAASVLEEIHADGFE